MLVSSVNATVGGGLTVLRRGWQWLTAKMGYANLMTAASGRSHQSVVSQMHASMLTSSFDPLQGGIKGHAPLHVGLSVNGPEVHGLRPVYSDTTQLNSTSSSVSWVASLYTPSPTQLNCRRRSAMQLSQLKPTANQREAGQSRWVASASL